MKKTFNLLASLTFGLLVASCQNGLEEVINESAVQDELVTTRAEDGEPADDIQAAELRARSVNLSISGYRIISGTNEVTYTVSASGINLSNYYIDWNYNTYVLDETAGGDNYNTITLKLVSSSNTSDTYLAVYLKSSYSGQVLYATTIYIGCNGPLAGTSSVRIVRASDGFEVYPSNQNVGLRPNTFYYGFFTNSMTSNMDLEWIFDDGTTNTNNNTATIYDQSGYTVYFKTNDYGWTFLTVNGKMHSSSVYKEMFDTLIYEGYDNSHNKIENEKECEEQNGNEE